MNVAINAGLKIILIIGILFLAEQGAMAQKKVKLEHANTMKGGVDATGQSFNRFIGDVIFKQNETTIYSDSAILYRQQNLIEAFGHVRIVEGDSITITAGRLIYDGNKKHAKLRKNVVFTKLNEVTLYTNFLDYDRLRQEARYFNTGKLVDSINVLTSRKGYFQTNINMASFKGNVVGENPEYTIKSDTMQYHTLSKVVYFRGPTELIDKEKNVFNYEEGEYNTSVKRSNLISGEIETRSYILTGDKMLLDDIRKYYTVNGSVEMLGKEDDVIITGDYSTYDKNTGIAKVYGHAMMRKILQQDTLYLTADTLMSIESADPAKKRVLAWQNVRIYKSDLQGKADSLAYLPADSIMHLYTDPVLWTEGNQMTADSINMIISNNTIEKLNMNINAFVISKDSVKNFNQVKGRNMVTFFKEGAIEKVTVDGNGESLFFALDETESIMVGMNKSICSYMIINFKYNKADNITFYVKPDASFIPPHELEPAKKTLAGFQWREKETPTYSEMLISLPQKADKKTPSQPITLQKRPSP